MNSVIAFVALCFSLAAFTETAFAGGSLQIRQENLSGDFIQKGYAEVTLTAQLIIDELPVPEVAVNWSILSADNRSTAIVSERKTSLAGLSWERPAPGNAGAVMNAVTTTDKQGVAALPLTDIIGERTVTVRAQVSYKGKLHTAEDSLTFGKGPLSLFLTPPIGPLSWLELYEICNGTPYGGEPSQWVIGQGFAGGDKVPGMQQIQSVSLPGEFNKQPEAMGAAVAAGWQDDHRYWNGRAVMTMRAGHVDIQNGNPHGSGGNDVNGKEYGVCLR